ncbi:helicase [Seminavis robusta]|uniref:Helicase n=1 Tax=Seminavis robusta TaxID=568900 RepID=A0A9N8HA53_9STRA|nr:helicase [Seminavis robusta]|eukprot:Sro213_g088540.1 helicase (1044) ;mRNA; r:65280-68576
MNQEIDRNNSSIRQERPTGGSTTIRKQLPMAPTTTATLPPSSSTATATMKTLQNHTVTDEWDLKYRELQAYHKRHGHASPLDRKKNGQHSKLFLWVDRQRRQAATLTPEQRAKLDQLQFDWTITNSNDNDNDNDNDNSEDWQTHYALLLDYRQEHDHARVSPHHPTLGDWCRRQHEQMCRQELSPSRHALLQEIGFELETRDQLLQKNWLDKWHQLVEFQQQHGHCFVSESKHSTAGSKALAKWAAAQRHRYKEGRLPQERMDKLNSIGFVWDTSSTTSTTAVHNKQKHKNKQQPSQDDDNNTQPQEVSSTSWDDMYQQLVDFYQDHGHFVVPHSQFSTLYTWMQQQRQRHHDGTLPKSQEDKLHDTDFIWCPTQAKQEQLEWDAKFQLLHTFRHAKGHTYVQREDNLQLWRWAEYNDWKQRRGKLPQQLNNRLDAIGFWDPPPREQNVEEAGGKRNNHNNKKTASNTNGKKTKNGSSKAAKKNSKSNGRAKKGKPYASLKPKAKTPNRELLNLADYLKASTSKKGKGGKSKSKRKRRRRSSLGNDDDDEEEPPKNAKAKTRKERKRPSPIDEEEEKQRTPKAKSKSKSKRPSVDDEEEEEEDDSKPPAKRQRTKDTTRTNKQTHKKKEQEEQSISSKAKRKKAHKVGEDSDDDEEDTKPAAKVPQKQKVGKRKKAPSVEDDEEETPSSKGPRRQVIKKRGKDDEDSKLPARARQQKKIAKSKKEEPEEEEEEESPARPQRRRVAKRNKEPVQEEEETPPPPAAAASARRRSATNGKKEATEDDKKPPAKGKRKKAPRQRVDKEEEREEEEEEGRKPPARLQSRKNQSTVLAASSMEDSDGKEEDQDEDSVFTTPYQVGTKVLKYFSRHGWYEGEIISIYQGNMFKIRYEDQDEETFELPKEQKALDQIIENARQTRAPRHAVGTVVKKYFEGHGWFEGKVAGYEAKDETYKVRYQDGDEETYEMPKEQKELDEVVSNAAKLHHKIGTAVKKFFEGNGWFEGHIVKMEIDRYKVRYDDGDEEEYLFDNDLKQLDSIVGCARSQ